MSQDERAEKVEKAYLLALSDLEKLKQEVARLNQEGQVLECLAHHNPAQVVMNEIGEWITALPCGCTLDCNLFKDLETAVAHWNQRPYQQMLVWLIHELMRQIKIEDATADLFERAERILGGQER